MDTQFKKGVLELLVLLFASKKDRYGYELVEEISKVVNVNEGTIYPILKRLTNEGYFETYLKESTGGPSRKYYKLTVLGIKRKDILLDEWKKFEKSVNSFVKESECNE
ncbi:MAG: PadR family transcriptional regulator [Bacilli bacterium]|nr:PadR family transcriptional regulator [Bacilli bacterium]